MIHMLSQTGRHHYPMNHQFKKKYFVVGLMLLLSLLGLSGCSTSGQAPDIVNSIVESVGADADTPAQDVLAESLGSSLPDSFTGSLANDIPALLAELDRYLVRYNEEFDLTRAPDTTPLEAAEAYMRIHQPGPLPRIFQTSTIYDRNGFVLAELFEEGKRTWVTLDQISPNLIDAIVATEDASFFSNSGIDPIRLVAAFLQNAQSGSVVSGASTITMQLARNLFFEPEQRFEQSFERKVYEVFMAQDLTELFTKEELLEMYLNLIYFGHSAYGPEAAAQIYYGKSAADLTLPEAAILAGLPQRPADLDPFRNYPAAKERQRIVLSLMVRHGFLMPEEASEAFETTVGFNPTFAESALEVTVPYAPHFMQYLDTVLAEPLDGGSIRRAGFTVYTTLDLYFQQLAEETVREKVAELRPALNLSNSALVAMQPSTGDILAMVGSVDYNDEEIDGAVNVAISPRQPGSSIKPILYATAFDENIISPASVIWDTSITWRTGITETYEPQNYDEKFHGPVTVRDALASSYNIPSIKVLDGLGVNTMLERARAMGVKSLDRESSWYGLSLTLGGGEVTLLDMTTAYSTLANQGTYVANRSIYSITNGSGQLIYEEVYAPPEPEQVLSPEAAFLTADIMSDKRARTPVFGVNSILHLSRPTAVKTGTTTDFRDNWTLGFNPHLAVGVWAGNSDGTPLKDSSGARGAGPIWNAYMEAIYADPYLLWVLGAPSVESDNEEWVFQPPPTRIEVSIPITDLEPISSTVLSTISGTFALDIAALNMPAPITITDVISTSDIYTSELLAAQRQREADIAAQLLPKVASGVIRLDIDCPFGLSCPPDGEYFTYDWLQQMASLRLGPLGDGVIEAPMQSTSIYRGDEGELHQANCEVLDTSKPLGRFLRIPMGIGDIVYDPEKRYLLDQNERARKVRDEQIAAMEWSYSTGVPLNIGRCEVANPMAISIFGYNVNVNVGPAQHGAIRPSDFDYDQLTKAVVDNFQPYIAAHLSGGFAEEVTENVVISPTTDSPVASAPIAPSLAISLDALPVENAPVVAVPVVTPEQVTEPVAAEPVVAEPVIVTDPIATEPATTESIASSETLTEPVVVESVVVEPVAVEPVAVEPVAVEPVADEPVTVEPVAPAPVVTAEDVTAADEVAPVPETVESPAPEGTETDIVVVIPPEQPAAEQPSEQVVESAQAVESEQAVESTQPTQPVQPAQPANQPRFVGYVSHHDNACADSLVLGEVVDVAGVPIAGVSALYTDEWGNSTLAISGDGENNLGKFDFSVVIPDLPHQISVSLVDETGSLISEVAQIPHLLDPYPTESCHYLLFYVPTQYGGQAEVQGDDGETG
ncbi:MAG: transglycosylase domain-containing protein [Chloroflexota bacterium]